MSFHVFLSQNCNLACDYCFARQVITKCDMPYQNFIEVLNFLKNNNESVLHLIGGEPTVHPKFNSYMKEVLSDYPNIKEVRVVTNGMFDNDCFKNIELSKFNFSVNITGRTSDKKLNANLLRLGSAKKAFCITLKDSNFDREAYIAFIKKFRPDKVTVNSALPELSQKNRFVNKFDSEFKNKFADLIEKITQLKIPVRQDCFTPVCLFDNKRVLYRQETIAKCTNSYFIAADLKFYICPFFETPLAEINAQTKKGDLLKIHEKIRASVTHRFSEDCDTCIYKLRNNCLPCTAYDRNNKIK
jgi:organic radical activating enzyme